VGTGSAFHVSLPAIVAPTAATNGKLVVRKMDSSARGRPARILLVDDQPDVAASLSRILDRWGHHVTILSDGSSALHKLVVDGNDFDVCITDLNMPGATGFEVVKLIRDTQLPVKVVVMGGYLTGSVREGLEELNVDAIVPKPFSIEDIEAAMRVSGW
jgi:two-component system cell cycle sensor histidine kinase/response regulator CckA